MPLSWHPPTPTATPVPGAGPPLAPVPPNTNTTSFNENAMWDRFCATSKDGRHTMVTHMQSLMPEHEQETCHNAVLELAAPILRKTYFPLLESMNVPAHMAKKMLMVEFEKVYGVGSFEMGATVTSAIVSTPELEHEPVVPEKQVVGEDAEMRDDGPHESEARSSTPVEERASKKIKPNNKRIQDLGSKQFDLPIRSSQPQPTADVVNMPRPDPIRMIPTSGYRYFVFGASGRLYAEKKSLIVTLKVHTNLPPSRSDEVVKQSKPTATKHFSYQVHGREYHSQSLIVGFKVNGGVLNALSDHYEYERKKGGRGNGGVRFWYNPAPRTVNAKGTAPGRQATPGRQARNKARGTTPRDGDGDVDMMS